MKYKVRFKIFNPLTGKKRSEVVDFSTYPSIDTIREWMEGLCTDMADDTSMEVSGHLLSEWEQSQLVQALMEESSWEIL